MTSYFYSPTLIINSPLEVYEFTNLIGFLSPILGFFYFLVFLSLFILGLILGFNQIAITFKNINSFKNFAFLISGSGGRQGGASGSALALMLIYFFFLSLCFALAVLLLPQARGGGAYNFIDTFYSLPLPRVSGAGTGGGGAWNFYQLSISNVTMSTGLVGSTFSLTDSTGAKDAELKKRIKELNLDGFLHWLTGFSDGESNFIITVNEGTSFSFRFRIQLHQDDHNVLKKIKYELDNLFGQETGNINFDNKENAVIFIITKYEVILNLIIPIFNLYPLRTAKFLDFSDFKQAVLIKQNSLNGKKIARYSLPRVSGAGSASAENEFLAPLKIMELKNQMNDKRTTVDQNLLLDKPLNPNWVIGFLEGESSFTLKEKTLASTFSVTQGQKSKKIIELLSHFFLNLPFEIPKDVILLSTLPAVATAVPAPLIANWPPSASWHRERRGDAGEALPAGSASAGGAPSSIGSQLAPLTGGVGRELNKVKEKIFKYKQANTYIYLDKRDQKSYFKIANRDFQFHCLIPFLERHIFYSRKFLDVQWWILGVKIKIASGYGLSTEAKDLLLRIAINMNDARYSTNKTPPQVPFPTVDEVNLLITELNKKNTGCAGSASACASLALAPPAPVRGRCQLAGNKKYLLQPFNLNKIEEINLITEKKQIYVYDRGQLVSGAPFKNMNEAGIALNTKNPYLNSKLDTGKLYLKRYSFYSKPLA